MAVSAILAKVDDVKGSLSTFVGKMEQESITWYVPTALIMIIIITIHR